MKKLDIFMNVLTGLFLMIFLLSSIFFSVAYHDSFYRDEFVANGISEVTGKSEAELNGVIEHIITFLKGEKDSFRYTLSDGSQAFNDREVMHMDDVGVLFDYLRVIQTISIMLAVVGIGYALYRKRSYYALGDVFLWTAGWSVVFVGFIGLLAMTDFQSAFTQFHHIFFTNDLWLLDPRTDLLIQMLPEVFFFNFVKQFAVTFGVILMGFAVAGWYLRRKQVTHA